MIGAKAAHISGLLPLLSPNLCKIDSSGHLLVNRPKVRTDQTQGSDCGLKIGTRTDARLPNELVFGYTFQDEMEIHQMRTRASPKREGISCLEVEFVASTCSKLLERASLDGFRAGKRERPGPRGNPFVV